MHCAIHRFSWEGHWIGFLISNSKKMYLATSGLYFRRVCPAFLQLLFQAGIFKWILFYFWAASPVGSPPKWALLWKCISCRCGCLDFLGQEWTMRFNHFGNEWGRKVRTSIAGKDSCQLKSQSRSVKNQLKLPYQVFPSSFKELEISLENNILLYGLLSLQMLFLSC